MFIAWANNNWLAPEERNVNYREKDLAFSETARRFPDAINIWSLRNR